VIDLVFMVPSSNSVGSNGWSNIISFVATIVGTLDIDGGLARVGLLKFVFLNSFIILCMLMYCVVLNCICISINHVTNAHNTVNKNKVEQNYKRLIMSIAVHYTINMYLSFDAI